jgi:hypothetical protein
MAIPNEDHLRTVYDSMLPGNPFTMDTLDDDECEHGVKYSRTCEECEKLIEEDENG